MKNWYYLLLVVFLVSCKSKAVVVDSKPKTVAQVKDTNAMSSDKIIQNHYGNKSDFSTLYIRSSVKYSDDKQTQNVSAEIKIKKGEKILVSIRFLGITMAKALITPNEVQYYEKIKGTYFEGDYQVLSEWLGTDLDYAKIQNLLLGQPIDNLTADKFTMLLLDKTYKLSSDTSKTEKSFYFDDERFLLKKQEIVQTDKQRAFDVSYANYHDFETAILPGELLINAVQIKGKTEISIEYNSVSFNEDLTFPYSVPEGYERIFIN
jgi:hypothetical protein